MGSEAFNLTTHQLSSVLKQQQDPERLLSELLKTKPKHLAQKFKQMVGSVTQEQKEESGLASKLLYTQLEQKRRERSAMLVVFENETKLRGPSASEPPASPERRRRSPSPLRHCAQICHQTNGRKEPSLAARQAAEMTAERVVAAWKASKDRSPKKLEPCSKREDSPRRGLQLQVSFRGDVKHEEEIMREKVQDTMKETMKETPTQTPRGENFRLFPPKEQKWRPRSGERPSDLDLSNLSQAMDEMQQLSPHAEKLEQ